MDKLRDILREKLFPEHYTCAVCGVEIFEGELCADCQKITKFNNGSTCPVCGRMLKSEGVCLQCKESLPNYKKAVSALVYDGGGVALISRFKNGRPHLARYFARLLAPKIKELPRADGLVFVPMTRIARWARGYNQSQLLAKELSRLCGLPVLNKCVKKVKKSAVQKNLPRKERLKNLEGCFAVDKSIINGKTVIVVDDVMTTGATLEAMSAALKKAGAEEVYAACVASVEYRVDFA